MNRSVLVLGLGLLLGVACAKAPRTPSSVEAPSPSAPAQPEAVAAPGITCPPGAEIETQDGGSVRMCVLDGVVHGDFARFGPGDVPLELVQYEHGELHGAYAVWDESGTLRVEGRFEGGHAVGTWHWYTPDGAPWIESEGPHFVEYGPAGHPRFVRDARGDHAFAEDGSERPLESYVVSLASTPVRPHSVDGSLQVTLAQTPKERIEHYAPRPGSTCVVARPVEEEGWPIADDLEVEVTVSHRHPLPPMLGASLHPSAEALHRSSGSIRLSLLGTLTTLPGVVFVTELACGSPC